VSAIWSGRSAFTQGLGFNKVNDLTMDDPSVGEALGLKAKKLRGLFMRLGSDRNAPMLDLVQFIDPPPHGQPYPTLTNIGICRIAFTADDIDKTYEELKAKKIECLAPLKKINGPTALSSEWSASWIPTARSSS
jgi:hypothetical protein